MNRPTTHWPQLDGLRGIAVLLVFVCHAQYVLRWLPSFNFMLKGWIGVDLFFVLSGFLITGILIGAKGSPNYFRAFYGRRSLRIWPIYFLLLALVFVMLPHLSGRLSALVSAAGPVWIYVLFLQNIIPYDRPAPLVVTWSLAVEEQFYICWSLLVAYLSVKNLRRLMWALLVLAPIVRTLAFRAGVSPSYVYFNLFHIDGLALGSICAIVFREREAIRNYAYVFLVSGLVGCVLAGVPNHPEEIRNPFTYTVVALLFAGVLLLSLRSEKLGAWLCNRGLIFFGSISYCLYLIHVPILSAVSAAMPGSAVGALGRDALVVLTSLLVSVGVATLSLHLIENNVLKLKRYFEYNKAVPVTQPVVGTKELEIQTESVSPV